MKRIIALALSLLTLVSLVSLASCGKNNADNFKVGAIYINSQNDTSGYTYAHHHGITKAMEELGIPEKNLFIVDNVPEDTTQVTNAIDVLAGKGCKIIFGISFGYIEAFDNAAKKEEYKDIIFSHATGYLSSLAGDDYKASFNNYFGRIYQARYLAGIAAGLKAKALGNPNVGYVAAWGTEYAETCSGINSFALGVQSVYPEATVHVNKISTWGDQAKERQAAETLIDTYNCCVIAQHCDSAQPQIVAANKNVYGCGYNSDMTAEAANAHLTAPIWNWNVYYKLAMETAMNDAENYMTVVGNYYGGLKEGFVDISPLTANCEAKTADYIAKVRNLIITGEWDVFSGVKLSFDANDNVIKTNGALLKNDETVIVAAGGASVEDGVITGSMNYYVAGVIEH